MAAPRNDDVKTKILDATEALLKEKSLSDISLAEIADIADISKGTLYYYYKSKTDIYFDVTSRYFDQQWQDLINWTDNKEKDTSIHRLVMYVVDRNFRSSGTRLHLINAASENNEELRKKVVELYNAFEDLITQKIAERTSLVDAKYLADLILLACDGLIIQASIDNRSFDADAFVLKTVEYMKKLELFDPKAAESDQ